jgi:hypothetical protein
VQYYLGIVYAQLGEKENARNALVFAVSSPESFHGKDEAKETLTKLRLAKTPSSSVRFSLGYRSCADTKGRLS